MCFNSLQTGKRIQSGVAFNSRGGGPSVSIPFKRESGSKALGGDWRYALIKFQFPSNGKADPKQITTSVSPLCCPEFQFPSNGKADPKCACCVCGNILQQVSIPFKRESGSKAEWEHGGSDAVEFQFPSNGKADPKWEENSSNGNQ